MTVHRATSNLCVISFPDDFVDASQLCAGEDMWHAYNLIREGDAVTATTFRKVQKDSGGTSAVASERIKIKLTIKVEEVDFDAEGATSSKQSET